jgi:hypothetical protein
MWTSELMVERSPEAETEGTADADAGCQASGCPAPNACNQIFNQPAP